MNLVSETMAKSKSNGVWDNLLEGQVARKRTPVLIPDVKHDSRAQFYGGDTLSTGSVPMIHMDKVIGVLTVSTHPPYTLDQGDMEFLYTLGSYLGLFIEADHLKRNLEKNHKEKNQQNRDLDELLATLSHDLRSPLATIGGYASLLIKKSESISPEEEVRFAKTIFRKTRETSQRLSDLITFFKASFPVSKKEVEIVNVRDILSASLETVASEERRAGTSIVIPEALPRLWGIRSNLALIFENLLSNAFQFTSSTRNPQIIIGYDKMGCGQRTTHVFSVTDNGSGIPVDYLENIFRLFSRVPSDDDIPGAGVGLAIVERVVSMNGGTIRAESGGEGAGATFTFTVPWLEAEEQ
jgi:signal transduction histidine kinase